MKKFVAILMVVALAVSVFAISASAAQTDNESTGASGITVHYYTEKGTPSVYYWNSLPQNISTDYPGPKMTSEGDNYYKYTFPNVTKINMQFVESDGTQSAELTRNTDSGVTDWYYKNGRWSKKKGTDSYERTDMREDSIYFVITTRFYDGDKSNNVHCWDDSTANNPDSDPGWRGDFKGLIQRLDYIKALGFTAVWITPVVENASGYDYHGYHAFDFAKVDPRYESSDADYQDLIDAAHEKGMKIVQDVVWNHTGNFGEEYLCKMFNKKYNTLKDLEKVDCMEVVKGSDLDKEYPDYATLTGQNGRPDQFHARLDVIKGLFNANLDSRELYHREKGMGYESSIEQQGSMAGDCQDINTENPEAAKYITETYRQYADMGVDAFRLDTEKHINRWTLNSAYFPAFNDIDNFFIFGEVCSRVRDVWNHNIPSSSPAFFTWAETESQWKGNWKTSPSDWATNNANSIKHYDSHREPSACPTSQNAFLNGIAYHTPDYSQANGTGVIDFVMHRNFESAGSAYRMALEEDKWINDATKVVTYVDSHDYGPEIGSDDTCRYNGGTAAWAENLNIMYTLRGIPCLYYGSEVEFKKGVKIDVGTNSPLESTGRAYFGNALEGSVTATDFGKYTASGKVAETLNYALAKHIRKLNMMRRAIPALQKGQYTTSSNYVSGDRAYIKRYTSADEGDSLALVAANGSATFKNIPNGTYIDAVTGDRKTVTNGTLTASASGQGNLRIYVCCASGFKGISGAIGDTGLTYMK